MKTQPRTQLPDEARAAIAPFGKAFACAQDLKIDPWEFALTLTHLLNLGVVESDLRWLVLNGYVTFRDRARTLQPGPNAAVRVDLRFMITAEGVLAAGLSGGGNLHPADAHRRDPVCDHQAHPGRAAIPVARLGKGSDGVALGVYRLQLEEIDRCGSGTARRGTRNDRKCERIGSLGRMRIPVSASTGEEIAKEPFFPEVNETR